jgi:hypothetical protein
MDQRHKLVDLLAATVFFASLLGIFATRVVADLPQFSARINKGPVANPAIREASGLVASRKNPGVLWTHNDSGNPNRLYALDSQGRTLGTYSLHTARSGIPNRDWEDIAIGPGPEEGQHYLYIGDIGDNQRAFASKFVYRVPEPNVDVGQTAIDTALVISTKLTLRYPDGAKDAETLMVDPRTKDIYIVSKEGSNAGVYRAAYPQSSQEPITLERVTTLGLSVVVAGDISPQGDEVLLKTYGQVFYWSRAAGQSLWEALSVDPLPVPYTREPQGEAVAWAADATGYYTLSERSGSGSLPAPLYFYSRLEPTAVVERNTGIPGPLQLGQNYPNPFNSDTAIRFSLLKPDAVELAVFNLAGQKVATLVKGYRAAGQYKVIWDGRDELGRELATGMYFYRLQTGNGIQTKKSLLLR